LANGKRGKSRKPKKATMKYCVSYGKSGGKRKCKKFGRRKMTAKQRKYFG